MEPQVGAKNMSHLPSVLRDYIGAFLRIPLVECTFCHQVLCWRSENNGQKWISGVKWYGLEVVCLDCWLDTEWLNARMYIE